MGELVRIASWYARFKEAPSESETITYLVVPLLKALGWTPQRMAIEWNRIDVALFATLPRQRDHLSAVVEAKKIHAASLAALPQAEYYANNYSNCRRIILTDGLRYGVFARASAHEPFSMKAHLNLTKLRERYALYDCEGAKAAVWAMSPEWSALRP